jgi:hypothetical protein
MKEKETPKYFLNERESLLKLFFKIIVQSYKFWNPQCHKFLRQKWKGYTSFKSKKFIFLKSYSNVYNESEFIFFICEIMN